MPHHCFLFLLWLVVFFLKNTDVLKRTQFCRCSFSKLIYSVIVCPKLKYHIISREAGVPVICQLRCYYCIHHLDGELPRLEVIRMLETLPDLLETDRCPGYATHEKDSWCCYIASHNPSWEWRKFHLPMWLSNIWLDNLLDKGVTFIWRKSGVPRTRCCPEWRSLSTSVFVHGWKQSEAWDWQTDWCSLGSDVDATPVCCGEKRAEKISQFDG